MFDAKIRPIIDPPLMVLARKIARTGISANSLTLCGLIIGLFGAAAIAAQYYELGLALILVNRLFDGLDGLVARINAPTDFGGYLDSLADFLLYVSVPVAFGIAAPQNTLPALLLVASITITAVSFLAYAAIAARIGEEDGKHGKKAFIYSTGLMEGAETVAFFVVMCLLPAYFELLAYVFAGLCGLTVLQRAMMAWRQFG